MSATTEVDLSASDFVADPYPVLAHLRDVGPMVWHEPSQRWLATTHAAVSATLRTRALGRIWSDWEPTDRMEPFNALHRNQMMENEPPVHTRLRRLVQGAFGRGHVERMRPRVAALAEELLDEMGDGRVDLLAEYAEPLPVFVICDLLGVPREDHARLRTWSQGIVRMYEHGVDETVRQTAVDASVAFSGYVRDLVAERTRDISAGHRGEDLLTDLIEARGEGGRLSEDELVATVVLLLNAGHEASVNVFGNGMYALLTHRDQLSRVTSAEVPVELALEEMIRFDAPLQLFERTATEDVVVAGVTVGQGQQVAALMGSANRDETVFAGADTFDVARDPNPHVGFGMGLHFCLGAPLARMELQTSVASLLRRHRDPTLAEEPPRHPTFVLKGFERLPAHL